MFIRLTRLDGLPIWLNASFIVTVAPSRSGGSIVVPIGDGFDYDVQEPPETVLALLGDAPPAKVVPVQQPRLMTPQADDVSPDVGYRRRHRKDDEEEEDKEADAALASPAKKRARKAGTAAKKKVAAKPAEPIPPVKRAPLSASEVAPDPLPEGFDKIVADLRARKCRTAKRIRNAIKSFFGKTDDAEIDRILEEMINSGHMLIGSDGHVTWTD